MVDDDENALVLVDHFLKGLNCEVDTCLKSVDAQGLMSGRRYDLAILDIMMPDINGIELCRWIKSDPRTADCVVIFMTALDAEEKLGEAFDAGALDYLSKPVHRHELLVRTRSALKMKEGLDEVHLSHANMQAALFKMKVKNDEARNALKDLKEVQKMVLFSLAKLAESRDNETGRHLLRVQRYVELIATSLSKKQKYRRLITRSYIDSLVASAPLHDIGKVGIPDSILLKPDRLSPSEFEVMKQHAVIGANTLKEAAAGSPQSAFLDLAIEIANYHHERYNGQGYPEGLKGEDIPMSAAIMSLADNYDALRTRRVYKEPFDHEKTMKIIIVEHGKAFFNPQVLTAFLENAQGFAAVADELEDKD